MSTATAPRSLIDIGKVIQNAVVFNFKNGSYARMNSDNLPQAVSHLFDLLDNREIDYVLVGGIAVLLYIEGRNTQDIDLIVTAQSLKRISEIVLEDQNEFFARGQFGDLRIDLLLTRNKLFDKVRKDYATQIDVVGRTVRCASVEGLLLLKLYALPPLYRQDNIVRAAIYEADITGLIQQFHPKLEPLFKELAKHLSPSDLDSVREIVDEIQQRIDRFSRRSSK